MPERQTHAVSPRGAQRKIDDQAEALFMALPATTLEEIRAGMQRELGYAVTTCIAAQALTHVRRHAEELTWTVPHVKRGAPGESEGNRYRAVLVNPDGSFWFDPESRKHLDQGTSATVKSVSRQMLNLSNALLMAIGHERSRNRKELLEELQEDVIATGRKARRMLRRISEAAA